MSLISDNNNAYFTCRSITFMTKSGSFLLRMINVSGKSCRENQNTYLSSINFSEIPAVYETGRTRKYNKAHAFCVLYN